ncbi:MAG: exosortase/archaeosortase family protein [Gemmataceae bacterium]|nr:exosortase/archaeosortase family protein [Gemmata sp.]MDW8198078.1 exosortase/archaeosortase family protein [Gemmataceae bacterium]
MPGTSPRPKDDLSAAVVIRSPAWIATAAGLLGMMAFVYAPLMAYCFQEWLKPDYSHGFLVPFFSMYLAWHWRAWAPQRLRWPDPLGLAFIVVGAVLFIVFGKLNIAKEWFQGVSLIVNLCGLTLVLGGRKALRWLWPAWAFLIFLFPLPGPVETALSWQLRKVASIAAEFVLQTIGYPTYREGIILHVQDHVLEVEKACSGLSMLLTFVALSVGMAILVQRPWLDRGLILVSAIPVAVVSNVIRIALTGVLYNEGGKELGDRIFHDFAGWLMMPIALAILWAELKLLDWVLVDVGGPASRDEVMKAQVGSPAHVFLTRWPSPPTPPTPDESKGASR